MSVCDFVSLFSRSVAQKQKISKSSSNLVQRMILRYPTSDLRFRSKDRRSRSQGHKVQKHRMRSSRRREFAPLLSAHRLVQLIVLLKFKHEKE